MKIMVDADACPVKNIIEETAKKYSLRVIMISNVNSYVSSSYSEVILVDGFSQAADIAIANKTEYGDIVVTQDYGLAALVLAKGAMALHPAGKEYTQENIDELLMQRFVNFKARQIGAKTAHSKKRNLSDDRRFTSKLVQLIEDNL